ncbi:hypothetical protein Zmor_019856 [Zophobas morio]|uniref:Ricin B lectin domain-containing protein n=1 Tax=Zophobas morio TaxID=2755281 RepID=A0AA38M8V9_9CUCU|nr:hypothetical protein Zmor_019856 [Zophobas morio]
MTTRTRKIIVCLILTCFASIRACTDDEYYIIRSKASNGLVLDGEDQAQIRIQHFTGFSTQLWKLERGNKAGLFYIVSKHSGRVMDIVNPYNIYLNEKNSALVQQWVLKDKGRIMNAEKLFNVDVLHANFTPGATVQICSDNGSQAQKFVLQKKT